MPISKAKRKVAAKKAARTRKRNQTKRRTAAKKAARTRKTKGGTRKTKGGTRSFEKRKDLTRSSGESGN